MLFQNQSIQSIQHISKGMVQSIIEFKVNVKQITNYFFV